MSDPMRLVEPDPAAKLKAADLLTALRASAPTVRFERAKVVAAVSAHYPTVVEAGCLTFIGARLRGAWKVVDGRAVLTPAV